MLSNKAKYGLKALTYLAGAEGSVLCADIARENAIPRKFLGAILAALTRAGILLSKKGEGGGRGLAHPADAIAVGEVIRMFDGPIAPIACADREDAEFCAVRHIIADVRDAMALVVDGASIAAMRAQRLHFAHTPFERDIPAVAAAAK